MMPAHTCYLKNEKLLLLFDTNIVRIRDVAHIKVYGGLFKFSIIKSHVFMYN